MHITEAEFRRALAEAFKEGACFVEQNPRGTTSLRYEERRDKSVARIRKRMKVVEAPLSEIPTHIVSELFEAVARYCGVHAHRTLVPDGSELEELVHAWNAIVMARVAEKLGIELPRF